MKKVFVLLCLAGILSGCIDYTEEATNGKGFNIVCLGGVEYYVRNYWMAVKYNTDGTISLCEEGSSD